jgi:hypothetical protein
MKTVKDVKLLKEEFIKASQNLSSKEMKGIAAKIAFYQDIIAYLESGPREGGIKAQEQKLIAKIKVVDDKIAILDSTYKTNQALSNAIKSLKVEFNYDKYKRQLEVIQFILN